MKNLQAFFVMTIWTAFSVCILYLLDAHINYREIAWAISISISLLIVHMVNMVIYFNRTSCIIWFVLLCMACRN